MYLYNVAKRSPRSRLRPAGWCHGDLSAAVALLVAHDPSHEHQLTHEWARREPTFCSMGDVRHSVLGVRRGPRGDAPSRASVRQGDWHDAPALPLVITPDVWDTGHHCVGARTRPLLPP